MEIMTVPTEISLIIAKYSKDFREVAPQYNGFTVKKKALFLEMYAKSPNITGAAHALGHDRALVFWHLERDQAFKKAFEEIREGLTDGLEAKILEYGQRPNNFMDRIAWLRARRPEVWNPDKKLTVDVNVNNVSNAIDRATAYEAELVRADDSTVKPVLPSITSTYETG